MYYSMDEPNRFREKFISIEWIIEWRWKYSIWFDISIWPKSIIANAMNHCQWLPRNLNLLAHQWHSFGQRKLHHQINCQHICIEWYSCFGWLNSYWTDRSFEAHHLLKQKIKWSCNLFNEYIYTEIDVLSNFILT